MIFNFFYYLTHVCWNPELSLQEIWFVLLHLQLYGTGNVYFVMCVCVYITYCNAGILMSTRCIAQRLKTDVDLLWRVGKFSVLKKGYSFSNKNKHSFVGESCRHNRK